MSIERVQAKAKARETIKAWVGQLSEGQLQEVDLELLVEYVAQALLDVQTQARCDAPSGLSRDRKPQGSNNPQA